MFSPSPRHVLQPECGATPFPSISCPPSLSVQTQAQRAYFPTALSLRPQKTLSNIMILRTLWDNPHSHTLTALTNSWHQVQGGAHEIELEGGDRGGPENESDGRGAVLITVPLQPKVVSHVYQRMGCWVGGGRSSSGGGVG